MAISTTFDSLLTELSQTRDAYESLRASDGSLEERASTLTRLHDLRHRMAGMRTAI